MTVQSPLQLESAQQDLLRALNVAAASLQLSARCESDVYRAFSEGISSLDLFGFICLFDEDRTHLVVRAAAQPQEVVARFEKRAELRAEGLTFSADVASPLQTVADQRRSIFVPDSGLVFQAIVPLKTRRMLQRLVLLSGHVPAVLSPIITEGDLLGFLCVLGKRLTEEDVSVVEAFANHTSIALDHARIISGLQDGVRTFRGMENSLRRRAQELTMLHSVSLDISASLELPTLLKTIVERSTGLLNAGGGCLYLCGPGLDEVTCVVSYQTPVDYTGRIMKYGHGAAGMVAQTGAPLNIIDYLHWPERIYYDGEEPVVTSVLTVPMLSNGEVTGALQMISLSSRSFTQEDQDLLALFADQASIAIENARLLEEKRSQLLLSDTLKEVGALLTSQLGLTDVLDAILDLLGKVIRYDSASVQLIDESGRLQLAAGRGYPDLTVAGQHVHNLSEKLLARPWQESGVIIVSDTNDSPGWIPMKSLEYIQSWLGAPLQVKGRLIGILNIDSRTPRSYSRSDGETAIAFANQAAIAIENARLYEAQERRAATLEAVHQASLSLTSSLDLHQVLEAILGSALQMLPGAQNGHIFLYDSEKDQLVFGSARWVDGRGGQPIAQPRPNGLTYTVAHSGDPVVVQDILDHPLYAGIPPEWGWKGSIVGLPLKIGKRVVGVMNISYSMPDGFNADDLRMIRLLGDQAAIAIENANLYERAALERRHLGVLYDLSRELATSLDANAILKKALNLTCQALSAVNGEAYLYFSKEDRLSLRASIKIDSGSIPELDRVMHLTSERGLAGRVVKMRQPVYAPDISLNPYWIRIPSLDDQVRSVLMAPILDEDRVLGVLSVMHSSHNAFTEDHLDLMVAICRQVALAMTNAEHYQQVQNLVELLEAERQQLISLIEQLPVGILLLDRDFHLMVTNPLGQSILSILCPTGSDEPILTLGDVPTETLITHQENSSPFEIHWQGPPSRLFEAQARLIGQEESRLILTLREVTRERENQARIQMQERLATVGQLASGIAHDFNNILAAILVYTDLLMRDLRAFPASRERLGIIQQQVQRASSLIRQILDFSRRSVIEYSNLDLLPFLKELYRLLRRVIPETVRLELVSQPGVYMVQADPTRLQQVFMNLCLNACDAMPLGGEIHFHLDCITLHEGDTLPFPYIVPGEWVRIGITDTGTGIPPENLPHIFEPFFTTKPVGQGTGLGLAQVYGIIKQHNGFIDVTSQVGKGTTFTIYLPGQEQKTVDEEVSSGEIVEFDGKGTTILLVEDDQATREALRILLESHNYSVLAASQGKEALDIYGDCLDQVSLVISDMIMPEMCGADFYQSLQDINPSMRVLFMTGHPIEPEMQKILSEGKLHWLLKPFSIRDLLKVVDELLRA